MFLNASEKARLKALARGGNDLGQVWSDLDSAIRALSDSVAALQGGGSLPATTGNDGYALTEIGGVPAFRQIFSSYVQSTFGIVSFATTIGTREVGQTVSSPVPFTAAYNQAPVSASVIDDQGNPSLNVIGSPNSFNYPYSYAKTGNNQSVLFTLSAANGTGAGNASASIFWRPRVFYGVGVNGLSTEADIEALPTSLLAASRATSFSVNAGSGQHIYYAFPDSYGAAVFTVDGFNGGFILAGTISVTNPYGVAQNYRLYKSVNANLGDVTVSVS